MNQQLEGDFVFDNQSGDFYRLINFIEYNR